MKLNFGSGLDKREGYVNVDVMPSVNPDMVYNLEELPLPWEDNSVDEILMFHFLEHLNLLKPAWWFEWWAEVHRILKPGGQVVVIFPRWNSEDAFGDPGHMMILTHQRFLYLSKKAYMVARERKLSMTQYPITFDFDIIVAMTDGYQNQDCTVVLRKVVSPSPDSPPQTP